MPGSASIFLMGQHRQFLSMCFRLCYERIHSRTSLFNSIQHWVPATLLQRFLVTVFFVLTFVQQSIDRLAQNANGLTRYGSYDWKRKPHLNDSIERCWYNCAIADGRRSFWMWNQRATAITCQFLPYTRTEIKHTSAVWLLLSMFLFLACASFSVSLLSINLNSLTIKWTLWPSVDFRNFFDLCRFTIFLFII